jgi:acetyl esterase/lipase
MNELERLEAMLRAQPASLTIGQRRAASDALGDLFPLAADVRVEQVEAYGVPAEWTSTPVASTSEAILHLHSGGYVWGSLKSHRHLVSELGRAAAMRTLALDYRRAPEFPFPHALEDAVSGYRFLLDFGFKPRQIAVAGDSAGGGLAVALLVRLKELGMQQPACALLLSPWVDMTVTADSYSRNALRDPVLNREIMQFLAEQLPWKAAARNASRIAGFRRSERHRASHDLRGGHGGLAGRCDRTHPHGGSHRCECAAGDLAEDVPPLAHLPSGVAPRQARCREGRKVAA